MQEKHFWGAHGEYGPFTAQEDGWPHAGEVVRYYRRALKIRAEDLAAQYSATTNTSITSRWILKMEQQNKVPTDITRRRILVQLLQIPPILLGLAPLEQVMLQSLSVSPVSAQPGEKATRSAPVDLERYEQENRLLWQLHETSSAHTSLPQIDTVIQSLKQLGGEVRGQLKKQVLLLLLSYYHLGSVVVRDQRAYAQSLVYADAAVDVATHVGDTAPLATAYYRRGFTNLTWGLFGDVDHTGAFKRSRDKIVSAIADFEQALPYAQPHLKGFLWLELGRAYGVLKRSPMDITRALKLIDLAEHVIGSEAQENDYPSTPVKSFSEGRYYLGKAVALIASERTEKALDMLDLLEEMSDTNRIGRNELRRLAWMDIQYAQSCIGMKEYYEATRRATNALLICKDIHSVSNIAILNDIYSQLPTHFSKGNADVARLGSLLADSSHKKKDHRS